MTTNATGNTGAEPENHGGLAHLQTLGQYQEARAHVFPTFESLRWFVRCNKAEVQEAGGLLLVAGRLLIDAPKFDRVVDDLGRRRMKAGQGRR